MKNYNAENVDEFIASAPVEAQPKLKEVRAVIKETVPRAEESISWGVPFYKYYGVLAGFSAYQKHVSFGLVTVLTPEERELLEGKGYKTGSKTIQIQFDQKVPTVIIKRILLAKAKANEVKKGIKG